MEVTVAKEQYTLAEAASIWIHELRQARERNKVLLHLANTSAVKLYRSIDDRLVRVLAIPDSVKCQCGNRTFWQYASEFVLWRCSKCHPKPERGER